MKKELTVAWLLTIMLYFWAGVVSIEYIRKDTYGGIISFFMPITMTIVLLGLNKLIKLKENEEAKEKPVVPEET